MVKEIIKILLCGVIVYPILYIYIQLDDVDAPKNENNWLIALVIEVIVLSIFIIYTILEKYKKNKKQ